MKLISATKNGEGWVVRFSFFFGIMKADYYTENGFNFFDKGGREAEFFEALEMHSAFVEVVDLEAGRLYDEIEYPSDKMKAIARRNRVRAKAKEIL